MSVDSSEQSPEKKIHFFSSKHDLREKYEKLKGKSLFLRFPHKLPIEQEELDQTVKSLCDKIIKVRRLRAKSTRCCLIDFNTKNDRDESLKILKKCKINDRKLVVNIPRTENEEFLKKIIEKRELKKEEMKIKRKLKKETAKSEKCLTSSIIIKNIPHNIPLSEIQSLFPNAIEILRAPISNFNTDNDKDIINVKFPTVEDAKNAKQKNIVMNGKPLNIMYDIVKKNNKKILIENQKPHNILLIKQNQNKINKPKNKIIKKPIVTKEIKEKTTKTVTNSKPSPNKKEILKKSKKSVMKKAKVN